MESRRKSETKIYADAQVSNRAAHFTVQNVPLRRGMHVVIGDTEFSVRDTGRNDDGDYIGAADVTGMRDGNYRAVITFRRVNPVELLFN